MKFGKVIRKAVAACPYVPFDNTHVNFREEWQDYWMDYKSFKAIIADISKEKKEKIKFDNKIKMCYYFNK